MAPRGLNAVFQRDRKMELRGNSTRNETQFQFLWDKGRIIIPCPRMQDAPTISLTVIQKRAKVQKTFTCGQKTGLSICSKMCQLTGGAKQG